MELERGVMYIASLTIPSGYPKLSSLYLEGDPLEWKMNCEFYFDMYQVPEQYKNRMAMMHFSEELNEWYRTIMVGTQPPPWDLLVEEVTTQFKLNIIKHPIEEFKRIHQNGTMEEYI
jgi:hypothetical protein